LILFIDDEGFRVENDIEELQFAGWQVHLATKINDAVKFLKAHRHEVECVICDVMMPHGTCFSADETRKGLRTGIKFFEWARQRWPDLPFVIFTNVSGDDGLRQKLEREPACIYVEKQSSLGQEFLKHVRKLITAKVEDKK
jgi:CheY-like chemotaxis protein